MPIVNELGAKALLEMVALRCGRGQSPLGERTWKKIQAAGDLEAQVRASIALLVRRRRRPAALIRWLYEVLGEEEPQPKRALTLKEQREIVVAEHRAREARARRKSMIG